MGIRSPLPPSFEISRIDALGALWAGAGLDEIETREIVVSRTFADFEDFWTTNLLGASIEAVVAAIPSNDVERLKARVRTTMPTDTGGRITYMSRANALKGRVPM
jgi:NAD(P)-dependent dehydrogenase (short-subunit alcohol dehydrogenase family)